MSFKFIPKDALRPWPIKGTKLDEKGQEQPFDFLAKFHKMSTEEWSKWNQETSIVLKNVREATSMLSPDAAPGSRDVALVKRVLQGWQMVDGDGNEIPFNDDNLEALLEDHPVPQIVAMAYIEFMGKGSSKPCAPGRRG